MGVTGHSGGEDAKPKASPKCSRRSHPKGSVWQGTKWGLIEDPSSRAEGPDLGASPSEGGQGSEFAPVRLHGEERGKGNFCLRSRSRSAGRELPQQDLNKRQQRETS